MVEKALQVQNQKTLELVVGMPIVWVNEELQGEAERALMVRKEAQMRKLPQQVGLQEDYLRALGFLNRLAETGISVETLEGSYNVYPLDAELMPPLAVGILHTMKTMPHPVEIEEWAILKPAPRPRDPYLAFKVAGRWYSVHQWE